MKVLIAAEERMSTVQLPRRLTLPAWEREIGSGSVFSLHRGSGETQEANVEGVHLDEGDLHLDFTRVEFADFGALASALLLIDATVRGGMDVEVTLPSKTLTATEMAQAHRLQLEEPPTAAE